jgi:hypothetical protein
MFSEQLAGVLKASPSFSASKDVILAATRSGFKNDYVTKGHSKWIKMDNLISKNLSKIIKSLGKNYTKCYSSRKYIHSRNGINHNLQIISSFSSLNFTLKFIWTSLENCKQHGWLKYWKEHINNGSVSNC